MARLNMVNLIIALGAFNAFLAVAAGAFAAHGLKDVLGAEHLSTFKTAADYQMMHGLGLILIGMISKQDSSRCNIAAAMFMFLGIVLFKYSGLCILRQSAGHGLPAGDRGAAPGPEA